MTALPADLFDRLSELRDLRAPGACRKWAEGTNPELYAAFDCDDGHLVGDTISITEHDVVYAAQRHRNQTGKYSLIRSCKPGEQLSGNQRFPVRARGRDGRNH
jgi:hypothetical protein